MLDIGEDLKTEINHAILAVGDAMIKEMESVVRAVAACKDALDQTITKFQAASKQFEEDLLASSIKFDTAATVRLSMFRGEIGQQPETKPPEVDPELRAKHAEALRARIQALRKADMNDAPKTLREAIINLVVGLEDELGLKQSPPPEELPMSEPASNDDQQRE